MGYQLNRVLLQLLLPACACPTWLRLPYLPYLADALVYLCRTLAIQVKNLHQVLHITNKHIHTHTVIRDIPVDHKKQLSQNTQINTPIIIKSKETYILLTNYTYIKGK